MAPHVRQREAIARCGRRVARQWAARKRALSRPAVTLTFRIYLTHLFSQCESGRPYVSVSCTVPLRSATRLLTVPLQSSTSAFQAPGGRAEFDAYDLVNYKAVRAAYGRKILNYAKDKSPYNQPVPYTLQNITAHVLICSAGSIREQTSA